MFDNHHFIANFPLSASVNGLRKSVNF